MLSQLSHHLSSNLHNPFYLPIRSIRLCLPRSRQTRSRRLDGGLRSTSLFQFSQSCLRFGFLLEFSQRCKRTLEDLVVEGPVYFDEQCRVYELFALEIDQGDVAVTCC